MTSEDLDDLTRRLLQHSLSRAGSDVNSLVREIVDDLNRGEPDRDTVRELRAAYLELGEMVEFVDEATHEQPEEIEA
jgi:hypothetical protein